MVNKAALDLITHFEGLRLKAYKDTGGVWTIGYGHTTAAGLPEVKEGMEITKEEAQTIFARDLVKYEKFVKDFVTVPVNQNQYGALVSFCYNLGPDRLRKSTLLKKLNAGDYDGASKEFGRWIFDNGVKLKGLERRRAAEKELFLRVVEPVIKPIEITIVDYPVPPAKPSPEPSFNLWKFIVDAIGAFNQWRKNK